MDGEHSEVLTEALRLGLQYAAQRGLLDFELDDPDIDLVEYVYQVLVVDEVIAPQSCCLASRNEMRDRLVRWAMRRPRPDPIFS